jgi:high-affinity iron transporter
MRKAVPLVLFFVLWLGLPGTLFAQGAEEDLGKANDSVRQSIQYAEQGKLPEAKQAYEQYSKTWYDVEDGVKKKSKDAYVGIEEAMGGVQFAFTVQPPDQQTVLKSLRELDRLNTSFINKDLSVFKGTPSTNGSAKTSVADVLKLLDGALSDLQADRVQDAKAKIGQFRQSWIDIEGVVLTQSSKLYTDAERDMVTAYAMLSASSPDKAGAEKTIRSMRDYLAPIAGKTSYTMIDVITILLREGLEAILVIVALLGFLNKSGHSEKKSWIWYGVGGGVLISIGLGVAVQLLFSSGAFGSNNFLIAGCTGIFAAVMLLYMSYWLHSKSSLSSWHKYISDKSTNALKTGSLWSLAILSFLAVFREGTETVLFFIGMASSIDLGTLLAGIGVGLLILLALAVLILKVGLKIPMRPFFLVSSILVFYLCFKFLGMGVHGLQLAGVMQASQLKHFPGVDALALYATWENLIPQAMLFAAAICIVLWSRKKDRELRRQLKVAGESI